MGKTRMSSDSPKFLQLLLVILNQEHASESIACSNF